jgi:hypothetical protein
MTYFPEDVIPAFPIYRGPDPLDDRPRPIRLIPPTGSPTCNFDPATSELVCNFKDNPVDFGWVAKNLKSTRADGNEVKSLILLLAPEAAQECGVILQLERFGFHRELADDPMFLWVRTLKPKKTQPGEART